MAQQGSSLHRGRASVSFVQNRVWWVRLRVAKRRTRVTVAASFPVTMTGEGDRVHQPGCVGVVLLNPSSFEPGLVFMNVDVQTECTEGQMATSCRDSRMDK